jgi:hypothetical protein
MDRRELRALPEERGITTVLYHTRQGVAMEFEMDGRTGRLKRWNLYAE